MLNTIAVQTRQGMPASMDNARQEETIGTLLYPEEYDFLHGIYSSPENQSPKFPLPDLISACVSLVFNKANAKQRLFEYARTQLTLRNRGGKPKCRQADIWRPQYEFLRALQISSDNRYPNPKFHLGDFTTACVALMMKENSPFTAILDQARKNSADRVVEKAEKI